MGQKDFFPRSSRYDLKWAEENSLGENVLHFAESLSQILPFRPQMRILDLGCGHAISSIFLAKEFDVQVWAVDRGIDPTLNQHRVKAAGMENQVFPIRADARALPFSYEFFDAIISLDAYLYFGTDERFLPIITRFLRPEGYLGIVDAYTEQEISHSQQLPADLREAWEINDWYLVHSIDWWKNHWNKTGLVDVITAERVPESDFILQSYLDRYKDDPKEQETIAFYRSSFGKNIGTFRMLAKRNKRWPHLEDDDGDTPY